MRCSRVGAIVAYRALPYVGGRVHSWLNAFSPVNYNATGGSYQIVQGIFGLAHGGILGTGLGLGAPQKTPLANSDFIFSSIGEELGLIGIFAILCLYLLFVSRGLRIGFAGQDDFGRLLGVGLAFVIALQVFIVVGGVTPRDPRSRASRHRSSRQADRPSSRTGSSPRCCCGSPIPCAPTPRRR